MKKKKIGWKEAYDSIRDYLNHQDGGANMKKPHRDLDGDLVFTDCDGGEFGEEELLEWYYELVDEGEIKNLDEVVPLKKNDEPNWVTIMRYGEAGWGSSN